MGLVFLATPFVGMLNREWHSESLLRLAGRGGPLVAGAAFAIAWTPCTSITLGAILTQAAISSSAAHGALLLAFYSAGLAIPFLLIALAFERMTTALGVVKRHFPVIIGVGGAVMICLGRADRDGGVHDAQHSGQRTAAGHRAERVERLSAAREHRVERQPVRTRYENGRMLVPALVFLACFGGGIFAATRWLPELASGPVGGIAFFAICGLLGAGLGIVGLHIYLMVRELETFGGESRFENNASILASGLLSIMLDAGTVFGLATITYLLAPHSDEQAEPETR